MRLEVGRKYMEHRLAESTVDDMPYIFIPSYNRPDFEIAKRILPMFSKSALEKVYIVVRKEQFREYARVNKRLQYLCIPPGGVSGVGSTRQWLLDYAIEKRMPVIMDIDDDIKYLQFLYNVHNKRGEVVSAHTGVKDWADDSRIPQKVLQLTGRISRRLFKLHPEVVLGNIRKQRFSNHAACAQTMYQINKGPTPRQTKIINVRAAHKNNLRMPEEFNLHGDDIGYAAHVLEQGFSCFNIPCLCYDYVDDAVNSVVRDPSQPESKANRRLHKLEYDALQQMDIKNYLRETFKFDDGQYKFGDINWQQYHKLEGTKPIHRYWRMNGEI